MTPPPTQGADPTPADPARPDPAPAVPDPPTEPDEGTGPDEKTGPDEATLAAIDRWVEFQLWHTRTPGAQVAIGVAGRPVFVRAYGWADLERQVPMGTHHLFRIASHSKSFTATLVLQLVEQGRLGLEDPVGQHLVQLDPDGSLAGVRVRELLEHTGGLLRDGLDADYWQFQRPFPGPQDLLELTRQGGAKAGPGEGFAYSNLGYSLLGLVVEAVTGSSFAAAAQAGIFDPLGLADTAVDDLPDRADAYAAGHSGLLTGTRRRTLPQVHTDAMAAATGFTSTATDLLTYFGAHAIGTGRLLSDRSKRLMQRRANATHPDSESEPGYGWGMILDSVDGHTYVGHAGGFPGHITKTMLDPATGQVVSVLTNAIDGPAAPLARGIVQLLAAARTLGEDGQQPGRAALARTGRYANLWAVADLAALGGRFRLLNPAAAAPLDGAVELEEDGNGFRITAGSGFGSVGEQVTFPGAPAETDAGASPPTTDAADAHPHGEGGSGRMRCGGLSMHAWSVLDDSADHRSGVATGG